MTTAQKLDKLDILLSARPLPEGWRHTHWRGASPQIERRWDARDPNRAAHQQRRCLVDIGMLDDGQVWWRLSVEDGPQQYYLYERGAHDDAHEALTTAEARAEAFMSEPVAWPKQLRCPATGRPCGDTPCSSGGSGCQAGRAP